MPTETFAQWLDRQVRRREWTQADLARKTGISSGRISEWLRGLRVPNPDSCDRLADALGADLDYVLMLAGHRPPDIDRDPRVESLVSLLRRIRLTKDRDVLLRSTLEGMLRVDRATEAEARAPRPQSTPAATGRGR